MLTNMNARQRRGIDKIPAELLVEIIKLATTVFDDNERRVPPSSLLNVLSLVCKSWLAVIRGAPPLWTTLCGTESPSQMRTIMALTKQMPLQLYADDPYQLVPGEVAKILFAEFQRMSVFHIRFHHQVFRSSISSLAADCSTSFLESFALETEGSQEEPTVDLFGGKAPPHLTKLSLGGCKLSWNSTMLNNLTSLSLTSSNRCGTQCFISALSRMSSLEELFLFQCVPMDFAEGNMTKAVDFPRLSSLHLDDYTQLCTAFLRRSRFQCLTSLDTIATSFVREDNEEYAGLFDVCRHHLTPYFKIHPVTHLTVFATLKSVQTTGLCRLEDVAGELEAVLSVMLKLPLFEDEPPLVDAELVNLAFNMVAAESKEVNWASAGHSA